MHPCPLSLPSHKEGGEMLAQPSQGIGDFPGPSCRVVCTASAKGGDRVVTRDGRRRGRFAAGSVTFMACFVVPGVFQKASAPGVLW